MNKLLISLMTVASVISLSGCDTHNTPNTESSGKWIITYAGTYSTSRVDVNSIERSGNIVKVWTDYQFNSHDGKGFYNQERKEVDCKYKAYRTIYQITTTNGVLEKNYSGPNEELSKTGNASFKWETFGNLPSDSKEYSLICAK